MRKLLRSIPAVVCVLLLAVPSFAGLALTRAEKASLIPHHSILKKTTYISKRSSMKTLQAKVKKIRKGRKSVRAKGGF